MKISLLYLSRIWKHTADIIDFYVSLLDKHAERQKFFLYMRSSWNVCKFKFKYLKILTLSLK